MLEILFHKTFIIFKIINQFMTATMFKPINIVLMKRV